MISDITIQRSHSFTGSSATAFYLTPLRKRSTIRNVRGVANTTGFSAGRTVTLQYGASSKTLGVLSFPTAAVTAATWAANASYGTDVLDAGTIIKCTPSSAAGSIVGNIEVELDPYALTSKGY